MGSNIQFGLILSLSKDEAAAGSPAVNQAAAQPALVRTERARALTAAAAVGA